MLVTPKHLDDFEIVVGLVSPIGTDLDLIANWIGEALHGYGYSSETVRLSSLLNVAKRETRSVGYLEAAMNTGDGLRARYGSNDTVAAMAIVEMMRRRGRTTKERRHAFVLRGLKHPDELRLLKQTYGGRFVSIAVFEEKSRRTLYLENQLRDESPRVKDLASKVAKLVERDELDSENPHGQHVRDAFGLADYYMALSSDARADVERIVGLMFGEPFITPRQDEVGMFHAFGASLRSADPGRQVGAVIVGEGGAILSTGSNEVPKAGGGEYWPGDDPDGRDFQLGYDYNKRQSRRAMKELLDVLAEAGHLAEPLSELSAEERVVSVVDDGSPGIKQTRLMSLIEFGRIVHAEMSAITQLARSHESGAGATLYTTAFPCHMCMRLIVSVGIARVVYVDPYPKSLAFDMYADSISADADHGKKILMQPYQGASWELYPKVFSSQVRKRDLSGAFESPVKKRMRMRLAEIEPLINADFLEDQVPYALSLVEDMFDKTSNEREAK